MSERFLCKRLGEDLELPGIPECWSVRADLTVAFSYHLAEHRTDHYPGCAASVWIDHVYVDRILLLDGHGELRAEMFLGDDYCSFADDVRDAFFSSIDESRLDEELMAFADGQYQDARDSAAERFFESRFEARVARGNESLYTYGD